MEERKFQVGIKALIQNNKNEILVVRANSEVLRKWEVEHWDLPGGRIKGNDSIEQTLKREVKEELGVDVRISSLFDVSISRLKVPSGREKSSLILITYLCKLPNTKIKLSDEHTEYRWAIVKEAKQLLSVKFPKSFIDKLSKLS